MILFQEFGAVVVMLRGNDHLIDRPERIVVVVPGDTRSQHRQDGNLSGSDCGAEPLRGHHEE